MPAGSSAIGKPRSRVRTAWLGLAAVLALGWALGNVRQMPTGSQAVILRFGRVVRMAGSGLVLALPGPLEQVVLLPGTERDMVLKAAETGPVAGLYVTGDGGVVRLDASIAWRIADAGAYVAATDDVPAVLRRLLLAASVQVAAGRRLEDFLPGQEQASAADPAEQETRDAIGRGLMAAMNRRLAALAQSGAGLGVEVMGADVAAVLPPGVTSSFDAAREAARHAEQAVASARSKAALTRQQAERDSDAALTAAHAGTEERLASARASTAVIMALVGHMDPRTRPGLLDQLYRERIGTIMNQAGAIDLVDAKAVSHLILPGAR